METGRKEKHMLNTENKISEINAKHTNGEQSC